jgi:hypothetical protein
MRLLFIHGRAQGGKDPAELKKTWVETAAAGFAAHSKTLASDVGVDFPYYGDLLDELTAKANLPSPAEVARKGPGRDAEFAEFQRDVLREMQKKARITDAEIVAQLPPGTPKDYQILPCVV